MKKLLILLFMALALSAFTGATVYYNEGFSNSSICSSLTFEKADYAGGAGSESHTCSVTSGIMNLHLKNSVVSGLDYASKIVQPEDFWNRNITYTMIFKKSSVYTDFYVLPFVSEGNTFYASMSGSGCSGALYNQPYTISMSMDLTATEVGTIGGVLNDSSKMTFTDPIQFAYPTDLLYSVGTTSMASNQPANDCKHLVGLTDIYNNSAGLCTGSYCVFQVLWTGETTKKLFYYINGNYISNFTYDTQLVVGQSASNYASSLVNVSESIIFSGSDALDISIDRMIVEEGNKIGYYVFTGGSTYECSDSIDNDLDGLTDYPEDPSCSSASDTTESPRDASNCAEPASCSQAEKCMFVTDFYCTGDPINFHGWTSNASYFATLMENRNSKILLNEYNNPDVSTMLPNGSSVVTDGSFSIYHNFSNKMSYTNAEHKFVFYFNNTIDESIVEPQWTNISLIGDTSNAPALTISLRPYSFNSVSTRIEIWTDGVNVANATAYAGGLYKFEMLIDTYKPTTPISYAQYDFFYRTMSVFPSINPKGDWTYSGDRYDFNSASDTYTTGVQINVSGYPAQAGVLLEAPIYMYLDYIHSYGLFDEDETPTQCTEWQNPFFFKEYFDGCLNQCGWLTTPSDVCAYGIFQATTGDFIQLIKPTDTLTSDMTKYFTFGFEITPQNYIAGNGIAITLYDSDGKNLVYLLVSDGIIYNRVDGEYEVLYALTQDMSNDVELLFDFATDTFTLYIGNIPVSYGNQLADTLFDYTSLGKISIISTGYGYLLDNLEIFSSDINNNYVIVTPENPAIQASNLTKYCGHVLVNPPACTEDSECSTGDCQPNGKCNSFDMTYCDEHSMQRGQKCFASAMVSCVAESTGDLILNNFLSTLIVILFIVVMAFVAVMWTRRR